MKKSIFVYFLLIIFLTGCATWEQVGGVYETSSHNYKTELPKEWRRFNLDRSQVLITKDGFSLQWISVSRTPIDKKLDFTQKKYSKHMLPQEAAEVAIANFRSNPQIFNMQIVENDPVLIGGYAGFKIVYQYQTDKGLTKKGVYYCSLVDEWSYKINYEAPARYYFERDLPALELVKEKFKLLKDSPSQIKKVTDDKSGTTGSSKNEQPQATVATKRPYDDLRAKAVWTGKWKVEGRGSFNSIWVLKQNGNKVVSTQDSPTEIEGRITGNNFKGRLKAATLNNYFYRIEVRISSDGLSIEGVATGQIARDKHSFKGRRIE
jgi:hypothetical protein